MYCYCCYAVMAIHPHAPEIFKPTQPDKVFYFGVPHNLQKPESYRPCHSLNPYRHRALCTRSLLLLYIGQTTRDKCTVIPVILLWLYSPKPPCTRNFQTYTAWQSFLLWSSSQLAEARRFPGKPQPKPKQGMPGLGVSTCWRLSNAVYVGDGITSITPIT